jgi:integrase
VSRAGAVAEGTTTGRKMHGARYTGATEFSLATDDIHATQQLLGHADVSTTANIYIQGSPAGLQEKLDRVWGEWWGQTFRSTRCRRNYSDRIRSAADCVPLRT